MIAVARVESVDVAVVRPDSWTSSKGGWTAIDKRPVDGAVVLGVAGVAGDTVCDTDHHGGPDQAVYAYSGEDLAFRSGVPNLIKRFLAAARPGAYRAVERAAAVRAGDPSAF